MSYIFANIILCIIYQLIIHITNKDAKVISFFLAVSFIQLMLCHSCVEINSVPDLPHYEDEYSLMASLPFFNAVTSFRTSEYLYYSLCKIVSLISSDFRFFLLIYNLLLFILYYTSFIKYSKYIMLSVCMLLMTTYSQSIFVLRQHLAVAIILTTYPAIINKRLLQYLLLTAIAFFVHHSAIIWLPVYFIYNAKKTNTLSLFLFVLIICSSFIGEAFIFVNEIFKLDYAEYIVGSSNSFSFVNIVVCLVYLITYIVFLGHHVFDFGINRLILILLILSTVGMSIGYTISLANRASVYFTVSYMFSVPLTLSYIRNSCVKIIYLLGVLLFNGYLTNELWNTEFFMFYKISSIPLHYILLVICASIIVSHYYKSSVKAEKHEIKNSRNCSSFNI